MTERIENEGAEGSDVSKHRVEMKVRNMNCWYCGHEMIWDCDYDYSDVYEEGAGIVTYLHCPNCGADCEMSLRDDKDGTE